ncbi:hypothetical protein [Longimicrobium sp.]|uniref:hypothetical protein n=1 Tax=Longimicrobium sp. TaxID=2029185 RepID=UPI003B3AEF51
MKPYVQQLFSSALLLVFGVLALLVWRRFGPVRRDRPALAWSLTATSFLVVGVYSTLQSLLSALGAFIGLESPLYQFVTQWSPAANLGRGVVSVVFAAMLLVLMVSRRRWGARMAAAAPLVLTATAVLSTLVLHQVPYTGASALLTGMALVAALTAIVLMGALFAAVHRDGLDQVLWLALAAYTLKETMTVSIMAVMAAWTMTYARTYFSVLYWVGIVIGLCMVGFAARRLQLSAGGRRVPPAFEAVHSMRRPVHG